MTIQAVNIANQFEVRFIDQARGCERPHSHTSLVISAVTTGALKLQINGNGVELTPGRVVAVGPQVVHCVEAFSADFSGVYVLEIFEQPADCEQVSPAQWSIFGQSITTTPQVYAEFIRLCRQLLDERDNAERTALLNAWLGPYLHQHFNRYPFCIDSSTMAEPLAVTIREQLDHCQAETPPYDEIARQCGYSKEHCNRIFRRSYHLSMQSYFLNRKANKAKVLIDSGKELAEITLECGFYDQSHFSRVFKEIFQISPASYRKSLLDSRQSHTR